MLQLCSLFFLLKNKNKNRKVFVPEQKTPTNKENLNHSSPPSIHILQLVSWFLNEAFAPILIMLFHLLQKCGANFVKNESITDLKTESPHTIKFIIKSNAVKN
jgi:hypothetical protein